MKHAPDIRIGIVGAGPAGLTAAETLKQKGYTDVMVLEKADHAGGKCRSIEYEGRIYELGAGVLSENNRTVRELARRYNVKTERVDFTTSPLTLDANGIPIPPYSLRQKMRLIREGIIYNRLIGRYHQITEHGLLHVHPDLTISFIEWAKKHRLTLLTREFAKYFTGFGYTYFEEVPAAYVLKYYSKRTIQAFLKKSFYKFPDGIQGLWTTVAKQHHVLYDTSIASIKRENTVTVQTQTSAHTFDALILTSPLDEALTFLDAHPKEINLFSKIIYCDYRTYACIVKGFPKQTGYVSGNFTNNRKGYPVFWYERYQDTDLYTFYILGDWSLSDEDAQTHIAELIRPLGGTIERIHTIARWKYFPRVSGEDMRDGYFDKLESLQGENRTYYAGELLNFSTVDLSASYAKQLVERFF